MRLSLSILVCLLAPVFSAAGAETHPCAASVTAKLAELGVAAGQVNKITYVDVTGGCCEHLQSYEAWLDLKQCPGNVVMKISLQCDVVEAYGRRGCDVDNLK
jgi:hypothetical protein